MMNAVPLPEDVLVVKERCRKIRIRQLPSPKVARSEGRLFPFQRRQLKSKRQSFLRTNFCDVEVGRGKRSPEQVVDNGDPFGSFSRRRKTNNNAAVEDGRVSTPIKAPITRLSKAIRDCDLSPIKRLEPIPLGGTPSGKLCSTPPPKKSSKFGNPLLSSTKLENKEDNDRLTNATRLYKDKLKIKLTKSQTEMVTSHLLHKNAIFDSLLQEGDMFKFNS